MIIKLSQNATNINSRDMDGRTPLMIACSIAGVRLRYALKDTVIMLIPMLLVLAALIIWPNVSLFLPRLIVPDMLK